MPRKHKKEWTILVLTALLVSALSRVERSEMWITCNRHLIHEVNHMSFYVIQKHISDHVNYNSFLFLKNQLHICHLSLQLGFIIEPSHYCLLKKSAFPEHFVLLCLFIRPDCLWYTMTFILWRQYALLHRVNLSLSNNIVKNSCRMLNGRNLAMEISKWWFFYFYFLNVSFDTRVMKMHAKGYEVTI